MAFCAPFIDRAAIFTSLWIRYLAVTPDLIKPVRIYIRSRNYANAMKQSGENGHFCNHQELLICLAYLSPATTKLNTLWDLILLLVELTKNDWLNSFLSQFFKTDSLLIWLLPLSLASVEHYACWLLCTSGMRGARYLRSDGEMSNLLK